MVTELQYPTRAMTRFLVDVWHDDHKLAVAERRLLHNKIDTTISTFTNKYNTFGSMSSPT